MTETQKWLVELLAESDTPKIALRAICPECGHPTSYHVVPLEEYLAQPNTLLLTIEAGTYPEDMRINGLPANQAAVMKAWDILNPPARWAEPPPGTPACGDCLRTDVHLVWIERDLGYYCEDPHDCFTYLSGKQARS